MQLSTPPLSSLNPPAVQAHTTPQITITACTDTPSVRSSVADYSCTTVKPMTAATNSHNQLQVPDASTSQNQLSISASKAKRPSKSSQVHHRATRRLLKAKPRELASRDSLKALSHRLSKIVP